MPNTISETISLTVDIGNGVRAAISGTIKRNQTGRHYVEETQLIGTVVEQLDIGSDLANVGSLFIKNLDASNFVTVGTDTPITNTLAVIPAGEFTLLKGVPTTLYAQADTAACEIVFLAAEA